MAQHQTAIWLHEEHKTIKGLISNLIPVVAVIPEVHRDAWIDTLRFQFGRLRTHIKNHMDAEESDGFMEPVLERRPTLSKEVEHLKQEHREIVTWLDQIWNELHVITPEDRLLIEDTCHRIRHLISALEHHEEHEELLVSFVFSQDIGSHD